MKDEKWWQKAVVYQIYPRSFMDSDGDGVGDIQGIIARLDYLEQLGIDAIWLSPVYRSPQDDNGYDISDYMDIDPMFGTISDMEELIERAKEKDIRIIMDLVLNHSSDEHRWFIEAKKSRVNPYHDYFVWVDGKEGSPPNDLRGCFGGSAWEWVPELEQYYFHQFSVKQPDLNWENSKVREEIYNMIRWWMKKGVGSFRLDVIDLIGKEPLKKITANGPRLHEYLREMNEKCFRDHDLLTVGETWGVTPEIAKIYSNRDGSEFSMVFQFEHSMLDQQKDKSKWDLVTLDIKELKAVFSKWQTELKDNGWNSLFWNNHDLPRIVSRWGDDGEYRELSAKMLATILHFMKGTPYIYQGEELGMTNVKYSIEDYRDIELLNLYKERVQEGYPKEEIMKSIHAKGRDNARTPMQWDDSYNAGFSEGEPWIKVNPNYGSINAKDQMTREDSIYHYYRQLIALRKQWAVIRYGDFELLFPESNEIFAYKRTLNEEELLVICNFTAKTVDFPWKVEQNQELVISNYENLGNLGCLRPYEAIVYYRK